MKNRRFTPFRIDTSRLAAATVAVVFSHFAAPSAFAQGPYYWDNLAGAGFGTAGGTWSSAGTANKWNTSNTGADSGLQASLTTATTDALNFGTSTTGLAAGTIGVSGTVQSGNMTFGSASGNINFTGGTINLAATVTINTGGNTIWYDTTVLSGGTTSVTYTGGGVLRMSGANSAIAGGNFNVNQGELRVTSTSTSVSGANALGGSDGWTVQLGNTSGTSAATVTMGNSINLPNPITVRAGSTGTKTLGINSGTVDATYSGVITANDNLTVLHDVAGSTGSITVNNAGNTVASGKTVTFSLLTACPMTDSSTWGGLGKLAYSGSGTANLTVSGAKTYSGGATLGTRTGGPVIVGTDSVGPANAPTSGPFGTGTLTIGATRLSSTAADRTIANSITFSGNPNFLTGATEKSFIFSGDAALGATRTLTVDTGSTVAGKLVEFQGAISGATFGITKAGAGVLKLSGANTYTGATAVNAGTLTLSGSGSVNTSSGITVNGATAKLLQTSSTAVSPTVTLTQGNLTGNGTFNAVDVGAGTGGIISNNNGVAGASLTIGALTFNGAATVNTFHNGITAPIVTTSLATTAATTVTINPSATSWTDGVTYDLISYTGTYDGGGIGQFVLGPVPNRSARQTANLINTGTALAMLITGDTPYWTGDTDNKWNTTTANNWKLLSDNSAALFLTNDNVLFNDNATGAGPITVDIDAANVAPNTVTFNNSTKDYVLTSTGGFGVSAGSLTKNGTGKVTIGTVNTYTGTTTINAGTLVIDDGSIASSSNIVNDATLEYKLNVNARSYGNVISGTGSLTKTGTNTLTLSGTNTFTGGLNIAEGAVTLGNAAAAGGPASVITFATGGATNASAQFSGAFTAVNPITVASGSTGTNTLANVGTGSVILTGAMTINSGTTLTVNSSSSNNSQYEYGNGVITGAGSVITTGTSTGNLVIRGASTYSGGTTLGGSSVHIPASSTNGPAGSPTDGNFGTGTVTMGAISIRASSVTDITIGNPLTLAGDLSLPTLASEKSLIFTGPATLTGTRTITSNVGASVTSKSLTFSGNIGDGGSGYGIVKNGTGNLVLSGANTYSGPTTVSAGSLQISAANNLGDGSATNTITLGTATLRSTANTYDLGVNRAITLTGNGRVQADAGATLTLSGDVTNGANLFTLFGAGNISVSGVIGAGATPTGGLNIGSTTLPANVTLSGNNLFTGNVSLPANNTEPLAILTLTHSGALGVGPKTVTSTGSDGTNGGQIHLQNNISFASDISFTVSGFTIYNDSGNNTINGNITMASGAGATYLTSTSGTLTVNGNISANSTARSLRLRGNGNGAITGVISNGSTVDLPVFKETGTGTWTLSGANTYTGGTTVSAGTLALGASNTLPDVSAISIGNATLDAATFSDTVGTLDVTSTATINLGAGAALAFADSSAIDWTGGTLTITGTFVSGASLRFGDGTGTGLTPAQLALISATGYGSFSLDANGYLVGSVGGYGSWKGANAGGQGPELDFDNDGVSNGVEYFMNAAAGFTANPQLDGTNTITWTNGGNIPASAYGTQFVVQTSPDLVNWTNVPVGQLAANNNGPGGSLSYTLTGAAPRFVRLVVTPD